MRKQKVSPAAAPTLPTKQKDPASMKECVIFMSPLPGECFFLMANTARLGGAVPYAVFQSTETLEQFLKSKTQLDSGLITDIAERAAKGEHFGRVLPLEGRAVTAIMHNLFKYHEQGQSEGLPNSGGRPFHAC